MTSFRMLVNGYPQHSRAPEALLSIAMCQLELKDKKAAKQALQDLVSKYPQSEAAQEGRDRLNTLK